ncbi:MAG: AAA family ATPase, partial [Candidatus Kryptonium sp.]
RETKDENFADLFKDNKIISKLISINATGAFIVNLVKYLSRARFKNLKYDPSFVISTIDRLCFSFESEIQKDKPFGF